MTTPASAASSLGSGADLMFHASPLPMWIYDRETLQFVDVNAAAVAQYGFSRDEFLERTILDIRPDEDAGAIRHSIAQRHHGWRRAGIWRHRRRNGETFFVDVTAHDCDIGGRDCVMIAAFDVTELRSAYERIEQSERRYRELVENLNDIVWTTDLAGTITYVSPNVADSGYRVEDLVGRPFQRMIHPEDLASVLAAMQGALAGGGPARCEYRAFDARGEVRHIRASFRASYRQDGQPTGMTGALADVTEQRQVEEQLRVSQRLEAIGRLAGGVAHDFNNLLVVIQGYAELAMDRLPPGAPLRADLQEILLAGRRAATLTQQLLAFGRKQLLRPAAMDLNTVVSGMAAMLQRVIGEDILFETVLGHALPPVFIDAAQLEHAILNLVINARDAMPNGGRLTIATSRGEPDARVSQAPCVLLTITDTGIGMDEATRARVLEPFFTTKPQGQGSGLGLPMVYGFVTQSGGALDVWSEPGQGCRVTVTLAAHGTAAPGVSADHPVAIRRGSERILVVEDEDAVRQLIGRVLTTAGYDWIAAAGPAEALALLVQGRGEIDLLLTDFVMPGMNGAELSLRARELCPGLRILFMTGYRGLPAATAAALDRTAQTLSKPFTAAQLTAAIRSAVAPDDADA